MLCLHVFSVRFCFSWERLQPVAGGDFDAAYLALIDKFVNEATGAGTYVMLDPHNYARHFGKIVGSTELPVGVCCGFLWWHCMVYIQQVSAMTDLWTRLANRYKSNPLVFYDLMNEPHDLPAVTVRASKKSWR